MTSYKKTRLWSAALSPTETAYDSSEARFFSEHFEAMRFRATPIVARILRDMPSYTVHDITHLDALWETASIIASEDLTLNPPEAFVFGGAILLHDAAMTLAAYPGGIEALKSTTEWQDIKGLRERQTSEPYNDQEIITEVLRLLHAKTAQKLATQYWPGGNYDSNAASAPQYLIENSDLRSFYGPVIGIIAHSHWWSINRVERELDRYLGAMPPHTTHGVDLLKLSCLLRVADAIHLDRRRAPPFVRALDQPRGHSELHWQFQGRIAFPRIDCGALEFTAGEECPAEQADSWWLGYDAFRLADRELRQTDLLLRERGRAPLKAQRVKGAENPNEMARYIPVSGWKPVETQLHISDVTRIIETLGGEKLYGDDSRAPLRELLQNAADAIQARRRLQGNYDYGSIIVGVEDEADGVWLSVEDNGVGMSERVLTNNLLDFGSSFWRSSSITDEFPTLAAKGMNSVGRFGIGFFSIFMLGDCVRITTKRFDRSYDDALQLDFRKGLNFRPIMSFPDRSDIPADGGTRIKVRLWKDPRSPNYFELQLKHPKPTQRFAFLERESAGAESLDALIEQIVPASPVAVTIKHGIEAIRIIDAEDWKVVDPVILARRVFPVRRRYSDDIAVAKNLRLVTDTKGEVFGRATIWPTRSSSSMSGVIAAGGFKVQSAPHFLGVLIGEVQNAARDAAIASATDEALRLWSTEQARLILKSKLSYETKALSAELVLEYGGEIGNLPIIRRDDRWFSLRQFRTEVGLLNEISIHLGDIQHNDSDEVGERSFDNWFEVDRSIFIVPTLGNILDYNSVLRGRMAQPGRSSNIMQLITEAVEKKWKRHSLIEDFDCVVGEVNGADIERGVTRYLRN